MGGVGGVLIFGGDLKEGFLRYEFGGLIHGGAYFRNFTVLFHKELYRRIYYKRSNHFPVSNHFFYSHNLSLDYRLILVRKKLM